MALDKPLTRFNVVFNGLLSYARQPLTFVIVLYSEIIVIMLMLLMLAYDGNLCDPLRRDRLRVVLLIAKDLDVTLCLRFSIVSVIGIIRVCQNFSSVLIRGLMCLANLIYAHATYVIARTSSENFSFNLTSTPNVSPGVLSLLSL